MRARRWGATRKRSGRSATHFTERSATYDRSSHWVTDPVLRERVLALLAPASHMWVLDIACGTGLVSAWFHERVQKVIGLDLTPAMAEQAKGRNDHLVIGDATKAPFPDRLFDVVIDSSEVGMRKPDPRIFELALTELGGIDPTRSVFLDDYPGNITAAEALGMLGVLVEADYDDAIRRLDAILTPA